jgi:hypothetical protein
MIRIICPNCQRILGDTDKSVDCNFNCRGCKKTVHVCMKVASFADYIKSNKSKEKSHD